MISNNILSTELLPRSVTQARRCLRICSYRDDLVRDDIPLPGGRTGLVAFAHRPLDARSACIAVLPSSSSPKEDVSACWDLGVPLFFIVADKSWDVWASTANKEPRHIRSLQPSEVENYFRHKRDEFEPGTIFRAKTWFRAGVGRQLDFVDTGLLPMLEHEAGGRLLDLFERMVSVTMNGLNWNSVPDSNDEAHWLTKTSFWLLAAKLLHDKRVSHFINLDLQDILTVFNRVAVHYNRNAPSPPRVNGRLRALQAASSVVSAGPSFCNISAETLGMLYEEALISPTTRKLLGTHRTPTYLVDYMVARLSDWIEELGYKHCHVFEPACGHAPFLSGTLRLLSDMLPASIADDQKQRHDFIRDHLRGCDHDAYYLIGVHIGNSESAVQHSLWADTVADEGKIWREFLGILETVEKPVLIHYGSYETTFLKRMCECYGSPPEGTIAAKALGSAINLISIMFAKIYFPTHSNGLKEIARRLGFNWSVSNPSGAQTIIWRHHWEGTQQEILERIVRGGLVHVDETRANIKGKLAYVWVLTNLHEVAYIYAENREGEMIQTLLREFKGVLVSDFYAAYDSIQCPQQKCLIHLMRDLNDDTLENPFDEELKGIVRGFAELLRTIVQTVDRYGLKRHFLRKHSASVGRFYKKLIAPDYQSEAAIKYKQRFEKNREKLFTFLNHDGIPWNNNNAEHAIKAFSALRVVMGGLSTVKGIEEYLTLLTICETCEYQGLDFLDFLRSGEKDIHAFAESRRGRGRRTQTSQPPGLAADAIPDPGSQP